MTRYLALVIAVLAAPTLAWGVVTLRASDPISERAAVDIGDAPPTSALPTTTTSPLATAPAPTAAAAATDAAAVEPPEPPTFDFVVGSGRFVEVGTLAQGPRPVRITIEDLAITAPIDPVGIVADTREMEVPNRHDLVGWYQYSPLPGADEGSSVLAAHVDYNGRAGVFHELGTVEPGAVIVVDFEDGSSRLFEVTGGRQYDKDRLPVDTIFAKSGDPILTLITCGGAFDSNSRSYEDNVVIYAERVDPSRLGSS